MENAHLAMAIKLDRQFMLNILIKFTVICLEFGVKCFLHTDIAR